MKILSKSIGYLSMIERYDLNETYCESKGNKGLIICYTLAAGKCCRLVLLDLEAKHEEIGVPIKWHKKYTEDSFGETFSSLKDFLSCFGDDDFGRWHLTVIYKGCEIVLSGERDAAEIAVSYGKDEKINLLPLLSEIETATYEYNNCDKKVLETLKTQYRMTEKRAVLTIRKLQSEEDIYREFVSVVVSGKPVSETGAVCVEGFTAERLNGHYPLSLLGAYNYLIYLRECPAEAKKDLEDGLPRK